MNNARSLQPSAARADAFAKGHPSRRSRWEHGKGQKLILLAAETSYNLVGVISLVSGPIAMVLVTWILTARKLKNQDKSLREIHVLVNSRLSDALNKIARLEGQLEQAGLEVEVTEANGASI